MGKWNTITHTVYYWTRLKEGTIYVINIITKEDSPDCPATVVRDERVDGVGGGIEGSGWKWTKSSCIDLYKTKIIIQYTHHSSHTQDILNP